MATAPNRVLYLTVAIALALFIAGLIGVFVADFFTDLVHHMKELP